MLAIIFENDLRKFCATNAVILPINREVIQFEHQGWEFSGFSGFIRAGVNKLSMRHNLFIMTCFIWMQKCTVQ